MLNFISFYIKFDIKFLYFQLTFARIGNMGKREIFDVINCCAIRSTIEQFDNQFL